MPVPYLVPFGVGAEGGYIHVENDRTAAISVDNRNQQPANDRLWSVPSELRTVSENDD